MDYTELFDRYIDGRLEGKELDDFKKKLGTDTEFRRNLEMYINLHNAAEEVISEREISGMEIQVDKETDQMSLKDIAKYGKEKRGIPFEKSTAFIQALQMAEKGSLNNRIRTMNRTLSVQLAVAAIIIVALLFTVFILLQRNKLTNPDLFAKYYYPYIESEEVIEITRSSDNFYYALKVFEAGDYTRAAVLFEQLSDSTELKVFATFYSGINYMQMARWEDAVTKLQDALAYGETRVETLARWYLGLCFLRIDDSKSAREQFEILASGKNEFTARSRRILKLMR